MKKLIIKGMDNRYFSPKIVDWYLQNKRDLPWRNTTDPYKVWLSEIILQQTRVLQGLPYYERFVEKYPTVKHLAKAPQQEVLRLWQGLGYYTRARNLHKCAIHISSELKGKFPNHFLSLKQLPGVGDYTAAAIASFSYKEPVAVVDGNVFRVLARIFGIDEPINSPTGKKIFSELANSLISKESPDLHNQALMEFGATFCTPKNPSCDTCIFRKSCVANAHQQQEMLPVKLKLKQSRKRYLNYLVLKKGQSLMMKKREGKDIWNGLYDFPVIEKEKPVNLDYILKNELKSVRKKVIQATEEYKHVLTHQTIYCRFVIVDASEPEISLVEDMIPKEAKFYSFRKIHDLPKPVLITRFLTDNAFHS